MRTLRIFLVFIMLSVTAFGQDVIIDFAGEDSSTLNYPNPFNNSTNIEFYLNQNDNVNITICDISGKIVANHNKNLCAGVHSFEFTANNLGAYFITVSGTNFTQSSKVICLSSNLQQAQLTYNKQITKKSYKNDNSKDFYFEDGDMLKLKGISGEYDFATVITVEPTVSTTYTFNFVPCQDNDGNNYAVLKAGNQTWMAENIKTTSYPNGDAIPYITDDLEWENLEDNNDDDAYCFYDNDENSIYGALYTYAAAINGDNSGTGVQGICPTGWHMPSDDEWTILTDELGGANVAGGKLKSTCKELWNDPNIDATNESGFTALPGGLRDYLDGSFNYDNVVGVWWSATEDSDSEAWWLNLSYDYAGSDRYFDNKSGGLSVRCVRDN